MNPTSTQMLLAYDRRRSVTGISGRNDPLEVDNSYHDFQRGWTMRGIQNRANAEFGHGSVFDLSPAFDGEGLFPSSAKERGMSWVSNVPWGPTHPSFSDRWLECVSLTNASRCVSVEFNAARGLRVVCSSAVGATVDGGKAVTNAIRLADARDALPGAVSVVEFVFPFRFDFKRARYERMELDVFNLICSIAQSAQGREKRARVGC